MKSGPLPYRFEKLELGIIFPLGLVFALYGLTNGAQNHYGMCSYRIKPASKQAGFVRHVHSGVDILRLGTGQFTHL